MSLVEEMKEFVQINKSDLLNLCLEEFFIDECRAGSGCYNCTITAVDKLAERIEREYLPRPTFKDGTPIQFGDEVRYKDGITFCVDTFIISDDGTCSVNGRDYGVFSHDGVFDRPKKDSLDDLFIEVTEYIKGLPDGVQSWKILDFMNRQAELLEGGED